MWAMRSFVQVIVGNPVFGFGLTPYHWRKSFDSNGVLKIAVNNTVH